MKPDYLDDVSSDPVSSIQSRDEGVAWSPLSSIQRSFWFLYKLRPDFQSTFHNVFITRTTPAVDPDSLQVALNRLAARHPMLRACFGEVEGQPVQRIERAVSVSLQVVEVEDLDDPELVARTERDRAFAFDICAAPLFRAVLYRTGSDASVLLTMFDHLICDAWSSWRLVDELGRLLGEEDDSDECYEVDEQPAYFEHVAQEREFLHGRAGRKQFEYWKTVLEENHPELDLPKDRVVLKPRAREARGSIVYAISADLTAALGELTAKHDVTIFSMLLSSYFALLHRLSGHNRVSVGVPLPNRTRHWKRVVGPFVNVVVLGSTLDPEDTVADLLKRTNVTVWGALWNQRYPLSELVERLNPERSGDRSPYFKTAFVHQKARGVDPDMSSVTVGTVAMGDFKACRPVKWGGVEAQGFGRFKTNGAAGLDLALDSIETDGRIFVNWDYDANKFDRSTIERFIRCWVALLRSMARHDLQRVSRLEWLETEERHRLLVQWNATQSEYPADKCIHELFEKQANERSEAIAVVCEDRELSYTELNIKANKLAHHLRGLGVGPDTLVAICVERGVEMVVGLMAVLKAGGAYVPLDPAYPEERLRHMLQDSAPMVVLTSALVDGSTRARLPKKLTGQGAIIDLDKDAWRWQGASESNPDPSSVGLTPDHLAYVIYTSGSTGRPKGVMIEHKNAVNFICWAASSFSAEELSHTPFSTSVTFDLAVFEVFVPLTVGATVHIVQNALDIARSPAVTLINTVPSAIAALLANGIPGSISTINSAGEPLRRALVESLFRQTEVGKVCNLYGPSETTTYSTWVAMKREQGFVPHIGRPIANTRVYILDPYGQPVPTGVVGEMFIGGTGVGRGYLNRPELTAERFTPDRFADEPGARMYKTGDLGRWLPDGNIEFFGRNDFQVKIRGFRVELGEIEARLMEHRCIREAVVLAREDVPGDKRLVAYYTAVEEEDDDSAGAEVLRAHVKEGLPNYMVPTAYVELPELPRAPNGKLNRKALRAPDGAAYAVRGYEVPEGEIEATLARIWAEVLHIERVGRHDNFFELGGHSLLAVKVVSLLKQANLEISVVDLFQNPTIHQLALYVIQDKPLLGVDGIIPVRTTGRQRPLFLIHEFSGLDLYFPLLADNVDHDIPVYGLPGVPLNEPQLRTMEGIATRLASIIRTVQLEGPYRLAGWSFGGVVAYEVAAQLIGQDQMVEFLGLLDSYNPVSLRAQKKTRVIRSISPQRFLLEHIGREKTLNDQKRIALRELKEIADGMDFEELMSKCREAGLLGDHDITAVRQYALRLMAHDYASDNYAVQRIEIPVHLFAAQEAVDEEIEHTIDDHLRGWNLALPEKQIRRIQVPGNHFTMMNSPHISVVGQALSNAVFRASNG